jgi:hypothetical protein
VSDGQDEETAWRKAAGPDSMRGHKHAYHCCTNNHEYWDSWSAFLEEFDDADLDMNLVFRWDWDPALPDWNGLEHDTLRVFIVQQRKGRICEHLVRVTADDEPSIRVFLVKHLQHLQKLWAPLEGGKT